MSTLSEERVLVLSQVYKIFKWEGKVDSRSAVGFMEFTCTTTGITLNIFIQFDISDVEKFEQAGDFCIGEKEYACLDISKDRLVASSWGDSVITVSFPLKTNERTQICAFLRGIVDKAQGCATLSL